MSIIPIGGRHGRISNAINRFPNFPFPPDLWNDFPFSFPSSLAGAFPDSAIGAAVNTRLDWTETPTAHILRASLPAFDGEDVLVELQDDRMLQISTDSGGFVTRFKIPESGKIEELSAFMEFGILTVFVPKEDDRIGRDVRVVEITGE